MPTKTPPLSLAELQKMKSPENVNAEIQGSLSLLDRLAIGITDKIGTMGFFFLIFLWTVCWLGWNIFAPRSLQFDPFPAFVLWLFISNMIQIFLMPLLLIGQNIQGKHAEARANDDYNVNKKAELEIETILQHLENQNELILEILQRVEKTERS